ncbi:helix-turn-helix transcriptional regulator [Myroides phaeus]|uniref:Putative transcriptional regulator n=1 Tax=Myroides phaeus TaxID=702745 RepID=A0A1G8BP88_9FLAO|nr:helix-turn-helix transcriptional regulator [Myroides phaeus]SDH35062.1 putative transcriptional regulator [Myroides phaeus]
MKNNVKIERTRCGLTQQELADLLAVSRQTVNSIEANRYVPSTVLALKLSKFLKTKVEELFSLEESD